jgi:hypothetical protein
MGTTLLLCAPVLSAVGTQPELKAERQVYLRLSISSQQLSPDLHRRDPLLGQLDTPYPAAALTNHQRASLDLVSQDILQPKHSPRITISSSPSIRELFPEKQLHQKNKSHDTAMA